MNINFIPENTPAQGHPDLEHQYPVKKFTVVESVWGKFILCRNSQYHPELMIKTGTTVHPAEIETLASIISTLDDQCVIIDAGANVGAFCVPMSIAAQKKKGTVYAFEVQKKLFQALCGTAVLNDFDNLEIYNLGLGEKDDTLKIPKVDYDKNQDYGIVSLVNQDNIAQSNFDLVDIVSIDSLEFERVDLIKIDVEGMEIGVLKGSTNTVRKFRPYFWIEYWNSNTQEIKKWFNDIGNYTIYQVTGADILCVPNEKVSAAGLTINCPIFNR
jgi:FkbM family methyltransferase